MKRLFVLFVLAIVLTPRGTMAQGWLNKIANDYRQRNQQRTTQRSNNQRTYQNVQRNESQRTQSQQSYTAQQSNNSQQPRSNANSNQVQRSDKVVTLVVNGTGQTKEEATRNALRSAIEQAFGTFVSANTEVLNDDLIKDEIVTVTTGNIKNYKELYCTQNGDIFDVSLQATVSIGSLISYAQNKGMKAELAGASFAMNMKMRKLNKENELRAMDNLKHQLCIMANSGLFDFQIEIGEPHMATEKGHIGPDGKWTEDNTRKVAVDVTIKQLINSKTLEFRNSLLEVLKALALSAQEREEYKSAGIPYYIYYGYESENKGHFALRNKYDQGTIMDLLSFTRCFFSIMDNLGHLINPYMRVYEGEYYKFQIGGNGGYDRYGGMRSDISSIYNSNGMKKVITKNTMPSFSDVRSYVLGDYLYVPNYYTGYKNDNNNCFIEAGLTSSLLFSQKYGYDASNAYRNYEMFMKHGSSVGEVFDKIIISLFYTNTEIENLSSIQVDPILSNFDLESFVSFY